jgi:hypothetical protein
MYEDICNMLSNVEKGLKDCDESDHFKKILKIVLQFGNFMNFKTKNGDAKAFKLSTLRKLRDARSTTDSKTTLLHFLVEVMEKELPDSLDFCADLSSLELASKVPISKIKGDLNGMTRRMEMISQQLTTTPTEIEKVFFEKLGQFRDKCASDIQQANERFAVLEATSNDFLKGWGEDPSATPLDEFLGEVLFFVQDFQKARDEVERRRQLEAKRKAMEEKKRLSEEAKANATKAKTAPSGASEPPPAPGAAPKLRKAAPPQKNQFGREMGPLDLLFQSINSGNFNLKSTAKEENDENDENVENGQKKENAENVEKKENVEFIEKKEN